MVGRAGMGLGTEERESLGIVTRETKRFIETKKEQT